MSNIPNITSVVDDEYLRLLDEKIYVTEKKILEGGCFDYPAYKEMVGKRTAFIEARTLVREALKTVYGEKDNDDF